MKTVGSYVCRTCRDLHIPSCAPTPPSFPHEPGLPYHDSAVAVAASAPITPLPPLWAARIIDKCTTTGIMEIPAEHGRVIPPSSLRR